MKGLGLCTLVVEFKYTRTSKGLGAVWIFAGNGTEDLESEDDLKDLPGWFQLVDDLDDERAATIHKNLKEFLVVNGVEVISEGIAS